MDQKKKKKKKLTILNRDGTTREVEPLSSWTSSMLTCPEDRHTYYKLLLDYVYCPYCGIKLNPDKEGDQA